MSSTNRKGHKARKDGNYATPIWAVRAVLPHLPMAKRILDPCAGSGNILSAISEYYGDRDKPDVLAGIEMDAARAQKCALIDRVTDCVHANALPAGVEWNKPELIVMNPPFSLAEIFVRRALNAVVPNGTVAVLLRMAFAAGISRKAFWTGSANKVADMAVLARRPSFDKINKATHDSADYAWFIFGPQATGRWYRLEIEEPKVVRRRRLDTMMETPPPTAINVL